VELAERILTGDRRALARAITLVESGHEETAGLLSRVYPSTGRARVIGVTGPPGAGKSSLVDRMIAHERGRGASLGVIAVDPSSAYSGGAILGDRVRMIGHSSDSGVFIRSMATRGHLGGLSRATGDALDLMDASGLDVVLVETVGVGQDEVEVVELADTVLVVLVPGMGDDIQAIKAGILEIADLFVINKSDREGADRLEAELQHMLTLADNDRPRPQILRTVAIKGEGIDELFAAIDRRHAGRGWEESARERRRARAGHRLEAVLAAELRRRVERRLAPGQWEDLVEAVAERREDPYHAVESLLGDLPPSAGALGTEEGP
jgi:LAO/AO transport system kinase